MRYSAAFILIAVLGAGWVMHERKSVLEDRLGHITTQLTIRHVKVHCQSFAGELVDVGPEMGSVQFTASGVPSDTTNLKRPVCTALDRFRGDISSGRLDCVVTGAVCDKRAFQDVMALHTLAHEAWHLHGIGNEAETECKSLQTTAQAAELFGADPQRATAIARYYVTTYYPQMPTDYRSGECGNGGPYDLRPADPSWP
jgi:hypothetical protein